MTTCPSEHKHALLVFQSRCYGEGLGLRHDIVIGVIFYPFYFEDCSYDMAITSIHKHSQNVLFNTAR